MATVAEETMRRLAVALLPLALSACQVAPVKTPAPPEATPVVTDDSHRRDDRSVPNATATKPVTRLPPNSILREPATSPPPQALRAAPTPEENDVWERLREGFRLPGCDYAPETERWARRYAASPERFAATLARMLPSIDYTQRRMEAAQLPGEFALLPIVESHFEPHPGPSGRPAGIWQMIGPTARSAGTRIDPWFDGRLNLIESTDAAVTLLDRYGDYFNDDWRLVAFAYNSGEYRVRKALDAHQPGEDFASLRGLGIASTTYEYLTKLLALSCLIREPERFDLQLPALPDHRELAEIELDGVMGVSLARALSGLSDDDFARVNGGLLKGRTPPGEEHRLLVSADAAERSSDVMARIPAARRLDWQHRRLSDAESLDDVAERSDLLLETLLAINNRSSVADIPSGATLWLPGRTRASTRSDQVASAGNIVHVVRRGESLWSIAKRYGVTVNELLRLNPGRSERLMPGQQLRLTPP